MLTPRPALALCAKSEGKGVVWSLQAPNALKAACEALRKEFAEATKPTRSVFCSSDDGVIGSGLEIAGVCMSFS